MEDVLLDSNLTTATTGGAGLDLVSAPSPSGTAPPPTLCRYHLHILSSYLRQNISLDTSNSTAVLVAFSSHGGTKYEWFEIVIPIICFLGIVGNVLNLLVLTRRRLLSSMDRLEKSANYGMIALAVSDMFFCLMVFPHTFISQDTRAVDANNVLVLYYKVYGIALINLFLMISTWLIVVMAVNRYIVVVYPLHARSVLGTVRTFVTICLVFFLSLLLTFPYFLHLTVGSCSSLSGAPMYQVESRWGGSSSKHRHSHHPLLSRTLKVYIRWVWPVVADFVPVLILAFCNARLIRELRHAISSRRRSCHGQVVRDSSHKVTLTLVIIVLMLLLLVSPSEILRFINPFKSWGEVGHVVAAVTNVMQTCNFAFNFVLYCVVNANFRQTIRAMFSRCLRDQGEKPELQSMLTHNNTTLDRTMVTDTELT